MALLRRGLALYQAGEPQKALDLFLRSRAIFPAKGNTINAALALEKLGRFDEALEFYEEAVASYSKSFDEDDQKAVPAAMAELRAKVGSVFVSANTTGSLVIGGRERSKLPMSSPVRMLPGQHVVRVIKDGYRTFEKTVTVKVGETVQLDAKLEALESAGGLRIEDPQLEGADVEVDGVPVGKTPWEGTLAPGAHVVRIRKGDRGSAPTLATVLQGQTALLRLRSDRLGPMVRVTSKPETAEIRLGSLALAHGTWEGVLPVGSYTFLAAEEGYTSQSAQVVVPVQDGSENARNVELKLAVDETHPRWPKKATGKLSAAFLAMYGLGLGLNGGADESCDSASCSRGLLNGPVAGVKASYEFPFRLSVGLLGGFLSLQSRLEREVPRSGIGSNAGVSYGLDELLRFKGYWLGASVAYRVPLKGRWSLRPAFQGGVVFARSSDTASGSVSSAGSTEPVTIDNAGKEVSSTPLFLLPEVGVVGDYGEWQVGGSLGAWITVASGPTLPNSTARVFPNCAGKDPASAGCVADSSQFTGESAYQTFAMLTPQVWLARVF